MSDLKLNFSTQNFDKTNLSVKDEIKSRKFEDAAAIAMFGFNMNKTEMNPNSIFA